MISQPEMLAFASVCTFGTTAILFLITRRLLRIVSALLEILSATVTFPERQDGAGQIAKLQ